MTHYIIDTSVIINAFFDEEQCNNLLWCSHSFSAPRKLEKELAGNKQKVLNRLRINEKKFDGVWNELRKRINLIKSSQSKLNQAESILRELKLSKEDKFFFAAVLYLKCPYYTHERKYTKNNSTSNALRAKGLIVVNNIPFD